MSAEAPSPTSGPRRLSPQPHPKAPPRKAGAALKAALFAILVFVMAGTTAAPAAAGGYGHHPGHGHHAGHGHHSGHGSGRMVDYVAFGDSYASGYGGGAVLDACGHTGEGYPSLLDALPRVELDADRSCAGATALSTPPAPPQGVVDLPEQIAAATAAGELTRKTDLVTVTIGGNDVQFGAVVLACGGEVLPATCAPAIAQAQAYAAGAVVPQLQQSFTAIRAAAPRAELVLTGYPHLFEGTTAGPLSIEAQNLFNAGTDALNGLLAQQVGDGTFVDVTAAFQGHGIGSADPWILSEQPFSLHPNATGYREGYLPALTEALDLESRGPGKGHCSGRS